jgi:ABC-2 type transport system ATP-binding protein
MPNETPNTPCAMRAQALDLTYPNGHHALKDLNLEIPLGDFFALLGHNGAGKTSFISILTSLINKSSGELHVLGHDIDQDRMKVKSLIGLVPQEINLSSFETVENILLNNAGYHRLPYREAKQRIAYLLKALSLTAFKNRVARNLSGGMKRRLMIARALIGSPKLLLLDEPTTGIDIEMRQDTWAFFKKINQEDGTTIMLTTHYLEEAEALSRNIGIINQGSITHRFSTESLFQQLQTVSYDLMLNEGTPSFPLDPSWTSERHEDNHYTLQVDAKQSLTELLENLKKAGIIVAQIDKSKTTLEQVCANLMSENHA